jgi:hypothetical protein
MSELRQFIMNITEKYNIYNKIDFLRLFVYILYTLDNDLIEYEPEFVYCLSFYLTLFQSLPSTCVSIDAIRKMFAYKLSSFSANLTDTLTVPYVNSEFGTFVDFIIPILMRKSIPNELDLVDPNQQLVFQITHPTQTTISLNGMTSSNLRGCIWKLLYANLDYILQHEYV